MGDFDDTDELPTTSEVFRVRDDPRPAAHEGGPDGVVDPAATTPLSPPSTRDLGDDVDVARGRRRRDARPAGPDERADTGDTPPVVGPVVRPPRFARARRRALLWDAGWCLVAGVVLLVAASAGRPVDHGPAWATVLAGAVGVGWAIVLAVIAAGGVGRPATAVVGLVNLLVGGVGFLLSWTTPDVPTLVLVLAAQVTGFGLVQVVTSVRR